MKSILMLIDEIPWVMAPATLIAAIFVITLISVFFKYRTYHGCAMPLSTQYASIAAWNDEQHVFQNRERYRESFECAIRELHSSIPASKPQAGFYLWLKTPIDDEAFAHGLYSQQNVTVLPGKYLSRTVDQHNPGANHVRIALVATPEECASAARRISKFISTLSGILYNGNNT